MMKVRLHITKRDALLYDGVHEVIEQDSFGMIPLRGSHAAQSESRTEYRSLFAAGVL